jgi:hypothetical protein
MYLVLGRRDDACCTGVLARLQQRGLDARLLSQPLFEAGRLNWRLDGSGVRSRLALDSVEPERISAVLVRDMGALSSIGWDSADHAYMQAEIWATLLAWLESLPCAVVSRMPAAIWYRPLMPVMEWSPLLRLAGLPMPEILLTSDPEEAREFGRRFEGALCTPLTSDSSWLVTERDWPGVARLQATAPVCLTEPCGDAWAACVVEGLVIWSRKVPAEVAALEPRLLRFAALSGLNLIEVVVASVRGGLAVTKVHTYVRLEHFQDTARELILDMLADSLVATPTQALPRRVWS